MNSQHYRSDGRAYYALFILTIVYSFNFIDRQLLAILQESIKAELLLSDTQLGLLTGFAFALFYVTAGIPIARWADAGNRRNIVALAVFIWSFMTAISGLVQNYLQLLLARIGVGVGEAGGSPPSHSMISDMFPAERRASALGFYSTGVSIGILFGFLMGGWLNEFFGWRVAFFVVGVPGVLLALVVRYTLREPRRGLSENRDDNPEPVAVKEVVALLWSRRSFRHMAWAGALSAFAGYSVANWSASFIIRSYGMSTGELGTWLALIIGIGGAVGVFGGGLLADKLAAKDTRWYVLLPALAGVISLPFAAGVYLVDNVYASLLLMIIPAIQSNVFLGNTLAVSHSLVGLRMRAMASA
ncbi:MAG: spinster family MFS transporter, partial [Spongiibacter marinus]